MRARGVRAALFVVVGAIAWVGARAVSASPVPTPGPQSPSHASVVIQSNTQASLDDVRIAAYNFRDEAYKDERGADQRGMTCALIVIVEGEASKPQKLRVHVGQTFHASKKTFDVVAVAGRTVTLRVR